MDTDNPLNNNSRTDSSGFQRTQNAQAILLKNQKQNMGGQQQSSSEIQVHETQQEQSTMIAKEQTQNNTNTQPSKAQQKQDQYQRKQAVLKESDLQAIIQYLQAQTTQQKKQQTTNEQKTQQQESSQNKTAPKEENEQERLQRSDAAQSLVTSTQKNMESIMQQSMMNSRSDKQNSLPKGQSSNEKDEKEDDIQQKKQIDEIVSQFGRQEEQIKEYITDNQNQMQKIELHNVNKKQLEQDLLQSLHCILRQFQHIHKENSQEVKTVEISAKPQNPTVINLKKDDKDVAEGAVTQLSKQPIAQISMNYQNVNIEIASVSENISKTFNSAMEIPSDASNQQNENDPNQSKSSNDTKRSDELRGYNGNPSQSDDTKNNLKKLQGSSGRNGSSNESPQESPSILAHQGPTVDNGRTQQNNSGSHASGTNSGGKPGGSSGFRVDQQYSITGDLVGNKKAQQRDKPLQASNNDLDNSKRSDQQHESVSSQSLLIKLGQTPEFQSLMQQLQGQVDRKNTSNLEIEKGINQNIQQNADAGQNMTQQINQASDVNDQMMIILKALYQESNINKNNLQIKRPILSTQQRMIGINQSQSSGQVANTLIGDGHNQTQTQQVVIQKATDITDKMGQNVNGTMLTNVVQTCNQSESQLQKHQMLPPQTEHQQTNQNDTSHQQNLVQNINGPTSNDVSQQVGNVQQMQQNHANSAGQCQQLAYLSGDKEKKHKQIHQHHSSRTHVNLDKIHNQPYFEDIYPQVNTNRNFQQNDSQNLERTADQKEEESQRDSNDRDRLNSAISSAFQGQEWRQSQNSRTKQLINYMQNQQKFESQQNPNTSAFKFGHTNMSDLEIIKNLNNMSNSAINNPASNRRADSHGSQSIPNSTFAPNQRVQLQNQNDFYKSRFALNQYMANLQNSNNQYEGKNKSKDSRTSRQSKHSKQSRNSEGQQSSQVQRQLPRKHFENDFQSHDESHIVKDQQQQPNLKQKQTKNLGQENEQEHSGEGQQDMQNILSMFINNLVKKQPMDPEENRQDQQVDAVEHKEEVQQQPTQVPQDPEIKKQQDSVNQAKLFQQIIIEQLRGGDVRSPKSSSIAQLFANQNQNQANPETAGAIPAPIQQSIQALMSANLTQTGSDQAGRKIDLIELLQLQKQQQQPHLLDQYQNNMNSDKKQMQQAAPMADIPKDLNTMLQQQKQETQEQSSMKDIQATLSQMKQQAANAVEEKNVEISDKNEKTQTAQPQTQFQNGANSQYNQQDEQCQKIYSQLKNINLDLFQLDPQIKEILQKKQMEIKLQENDTQQHKVENQPQQTAGGAILPKTKTPNGQEGVGQGHSSTEREEASNDLDFQKLHDIIENYIPPRTQNVDQRPPIQNQLIDQLQNQQQLVPVAIKQQELLQDQNNQQQLLRVIAPNHQGLLANNKQPPMRYNGPTSSSSGEEQNRQGNGKSTGSGQNNGNGSSSICAQSYQQQNNQTQQNGSYDQSQQLSLDITKQLLQLAQNGNPAINLQSLLTARNSQAVMNQKDSILGKRGTVDREDLQQQSQPAAANPQQIQLNQITQLLQMHQNKTQDHRSALITKISEAENQQFPRKRQQIEEPTQTGDNSLVSALLKMKQEQMMINRQRQMSQYDSMPIDSSAHQNQSQPMYDEDDDGDAPMQIRLRNQIKQSQSLSQYRQVKIELLKALKHEPDLNKIIVDAKPKRIHHNIGGNNFRGSRYRGVSKNKNKWQMMIMINQKKVYIGAIQNEDDAAKYYDHIAIISQGLSAKTNFKYSGHKIKQIIADYDIETSNSASNEYMSGYNSINSGNNDANLMQQMGLYRRNVRQPEQNNLFYNQASAADPSQSIGFQTLKNQISNQIQVQSQNQSGLQSLLSILEQAKQQHQPQPQQQQQSFAEQQTPRQQQQPLNLDSTQLQLLQKLGLGQQVNNQQNLAAKLQQQSLLGAKPVLNAQQQQPNHQQASHMNSRQPSQSVQILNKLFAYQNLSNQNSQLDSSGQFQRPQPKKQIHSENWQNKWDHLMSYAKENLGQNQQFTAPMKNTMLPIYQQNPGEMKTESLQDILGQVNISNGGQVDASTLQHQQQSMLDEDQKNNN